MKNIHAALAMLGVSVVSVLLTANAIKPKQSEIALYVQAPAAGQDAYHVTYECKRNDEVGLLLPDMQEAVSGILADIGKGWAVYETKRGLCRQTTLMNREVTTRLDSKHLIGAAADFVCWDENGKASWDCSWDTLGAACKKHGLLWGGDFPTPDVPHCELPPLQPL